MSQKPVKPFDFDAAVAEAKRDFPAQTENVTFINGDDPEAREKLFKWAVSQKMRTLEWDRMLAPMMDNKLCCAVPGHNGGVVLLVHPSAPSMRFGEDHDKSNYYSFDHELGHIVTRLGMGHGQDVAEHSADSFAALRGLQRGTLTKQDVKRAADLNDAGFLLYCGLSHLTSMTLDAIVINPKNIDYLGLSPQKTAALADQHAKAFELPNRTYNKFAPIDEIGKPKWNDDGLPLEERVEARLHALTEIAMNAPKSSMSFYLAARLIVNTVENNGVTYAGTYVPLDGQNTHWQSLKDAVLTRAGDRDIGARKALQDSALTRPKTPEDDTLLTRFSNRFKKLSI